MLIVKPLRTHSSDFFIEVDDSCPMGYLVSMRDGPKALPNGESCCDTAVAASLGNSGRRSGQEIYFEVVLWFQGRGERYLRMEIEFYTQL